MSASKDSDAGFPWFEEQNITGWLVQFRVHLCKAGAHVVLDRPRPSDLDAQENPIPMNAQQRRTFNDEVAEYDRLDNIAFSELMKASRQNVKVKTSQKQANSIQRMNFFSACDNAIILSMI